MTDTHQPAGNSNRFEKHPVITILMVIAFFMVICAVVFAVLHFHRLRLIPPTEEIIDAAFTYRRSSPIYHHGFVKNKIVEASSWGDSTYPLYTNSLGFKDISTRAVSLVTDDYRLVFMGDSFTEGIGVAYEKTFAGLVEERLTPCRVEILNAATISYSPIIYWRKTKHLIEEVGLRFDEMAVFLDISDVRDEAVSYYLDENGNVRSRLFSDRTSRKIIGRIRKDGVIDSLSRYMGILMAFSESPHWETGRWTIDPDLYEKYGRPGLRQMDFYMSRLKDLLDEHDIKMTVAVFPWPLQLKEEDRHSIHSEYWRDWCRRHAVDFIDYFPVFFEAMEEAPVAAVIEKFFINNDSHWNENGHRLVAEVFCRQFLSRRPCPLPPPPP